MCRCFVHIGTHKTGTTSIQQALAGGRARLKDAGFVYPKAGIPAASFGHHNIAWGISGDRRYRPEHGSLDDLLAEIAGMNRNIVMSSEDLECSIHHPEAFRCFVERLEQVTPGVTLIVYLRNQIDYIQSLFFELIHHGYDRTFDQFVSEILGHRMLRWREWIFPFCYREFLKRLPNGVAVVVRPYDALQSVVDDFFSLLGLVPTDCAYDPGLRSNPRLPLDIVFRKFCENYLGLKLETDNPEIRSLLARLTPGDHVDMSPDNKAKLFAAFDESNRWVMSCYGLPDVLNRNYRQVPLPTGSPDHAWLEDIFSPTTLDSVDAAARRLGAPDRRPSG